MSSLGLYHDDLCGWFPPCMFLPSEYEYFFGFINMYSLDFCLISSGVGALCFDIEYYATSIVLKSSLLNPSINFEAMLKFLLFVDSSGSLLLLNLSRSSRNLSIDSYSLCLLFQLSSSLDDPSSLTRIGSRVSRKFCPLYHAPPPSLLPRILVRCLLNCLVLPCKPAFHRSSCLVLDVVSLRQPMCQCIHLNGP